MQRYRRVITLGEAKVIDERSAQAYATVCWILFLSLEIGYWILSKLQMAHTFLCVYQILYLIGSHFLGRQ